MRKRKVMKKEVYISLIILMLLVVQNYAKAYVVYTPDSDIKFNYVSYDYNNLLALVTMSNNILPDVDTEKILLDIDSDMSIAKIIDDDFSLEMDLDANAKKQIKPKANIIEGYKIDSKTSKCVEKVMKPHVKKYKIQEENIIGDEIENIDVDKVTDIKEVAVKQKQERIAKEKKQRQERIAKANQQKKERTGLLSWFRRDKTKIAKIDETMPSKISDVSNLTSNKNVNKLAQTDQNVSRSLTKNNTSVKNSKIAENTEILTDEVFDADKMEQPKLQQKKHHERKKEEMHIAKENLKLAKPQKEKPVKVAKVTEPKVEKVKPVKVAKAAEPKVEKVKPVKVAKVAEPKVEKVKPVKVAKVAEPKVEKVKPVKVAKVAEPKVEKVKPVKVAKVAEPKVEKVKPIKVAKVAEPKPIKVKEEMPIIAKTEKIAKADQPIQKINFVETNAENDEFDIDRNNNIVSKPQKPAKVIKQKSIKISKATEQKPVKVKTEKVKPVKVAKAVDKNINAKENKIQQPVSMPVVNNTILTNATLASAYGKRSISALSITNTQNQILKTALSPTSQSEQVKTKKVKPVKVAKVAEPKVEKVKPVKVAKVAEPKVEKVKPVKSKEIRTASGRNIPIQQQEHVKPVAQVQELHASEDLYKIPQPQETPVYSAFETMQSRLPLVRRPFDTDDI